MIQSKRMRQAWHVACTGEKKCTQGFGFKKLRKDTGRRIILNKTHRNRIRRHGLVSCGSRM
jgi:hypothetical protein